MTNFIKYTFLCLTFSFAAFAKGNDLSSKNTKLIMSGREDWIGFISHYPILKEGADLLPKTGNSVIAVRPAEWSRIEPRKNDFHFDDIDKTLSYAEKNDIYCVAMIEIDPCHTPKWLKQEIKERGETQKDAFIYYFNEPALHSKYFRDRMNVAITNIISYIKKKDKKHRIVGYIAGAEWWYYLGGRYQKVDIDAFKKWLKNKYKNDISALSKEWGKKFKNFNEVKPIRAAYSWGLGDGENKGTANLPVRDYDKLTLVYIKSSKKYKINPGDSPVFKIKVKTENLRGGGVTLKLIAHSKISAPAVLYSPTINGTHDWMELAVKDYPFPPERDFAEVEVHFLGSGKAWIDDLYLGPKNGKTNYLANSNFERKNFIGWKTNCWSTEGKYNLELKANKGINQSFCIEFSNSSPPILHKKSDPNINKQWSDFQEFGHDSVTNLFDYLGESIKKIDTSRPVISYGTCLYTYFWGWDELQNGMDLRKIAKMKNMDFLGAQLPSHRGDFHPITCPLDIARKYKKPLYVMDLLDWTAGPEIGFDKMMRVAHATLQHGANGFLTYCWFAPGGDYKFFTKWSDDELKKFNVYSRIARKFTQKKKINPDLLLVMPMLETTWTDPNGIKNDPEDFVGWYKMLIQNQYYFDVALFDDLSEETDLKKYKTIVIPDCAYINEKIIEKLNSYLKNGGNIVSSARFALYNEYGKPLSFSFDNSKGKYIKVDSVTFYDSDKLRKITGGIGKAYLEKVRRFNLRWNTPPLFHVMNKNYMNENRIKLRKSVRQVLEKSGYKPSISFAKDYPYVEAVLFEGKKEKLIYFVYNGENEKCEPLTITFYSKKKVKSMNAVYDMLTSEETDFKREGNRYKFSIKPFKHACILILK